MFEQIVVGVDGHAGGLDAIALAKHLLDADGELTLAHVLAHDGHAHRGPGESYEASGCARAAKLLERMQAETGVHAHLRWRVAGYVGRGLHELCEVIGADLLVVSSSRRGLVGRVLLGDDTRPALDGAPCAIAIAPTNYARDPVMMRELGVGYDGTPESEHALELARKLAQELGVQLSGFQAIPVPSTALSTGPLPFGGMVSALVAEARERIAALGDIEPHAAYGEAVRG